ncbi:MAG TPA: HAMP domain-containing sensor histidine kinase [Tepidisphaeraceae bacterium]
MAMADFILANIEPILADWEVFARGIQAGATMDPAALRDDAEMILRTTARDMRTAQSEAQRAEKSRGGASPSENSAQVNAASTLHAMSRVDSGFALMDVVAEYRALRAGVIRLWRKGAPHPGPAGLDELTRFNESIDQSLVRAVRSYGQRIDQSRQLFLAILGHDLRNPLNAVKMSAQVLSRPGECRPEVSMFPAGILASAAAMEGLIGDLLDFAAAGLGGKLPIEPAAMDLAALCREVVAEMRAGYPDRALRFASHGDLTGKWDAGRLRQVVSNLLANALQHGAPDRPVKLSVRTKGPDVLLSVANAGMPIPPAALATMFEPLVRGSGADRTSPRRPGSIGLGLYIARAVVLAHGGEIDVHSSKPAGTTFTVHLPPAASNSSGVPPAPAVGKSKKPAAKGGRRGRRGDKAGGVTR